MRKSFLALGAIAGLSLMGSTALAQLSGGIKAPVSADMWKNKLTAKAAAYMENKGQWAPEALFVSQRKGMNFWVTRGGAVIDLYRNAIGSDPKDGLHRMGQVVEISYVGTNPSALDVSANTPVDLKTDFVKIDGGRSVSKVKSFMDADVKNIYSGIDAHYYQEDLSPRYDLIVHPFANPNQIKMEFNGADSVRILPSGDVEINTSAGTITQKGLTVYQVSGSKKSQVDAKFVKLNDNTIGFQVGKYDHSKKLVIDPLVYGSYIGGDFGTEVTTDIVSNNAGQVYVVGETTSPDFPLTAGPYNVNLRDTQDTFLVAMTGDAYDVSYAAYIASAFEDANARVQLDQYGNVWLAGSTRSLKGVRDLDVTIKNNGAPTAGTWRIQYGGLQTASIVFNATAAQVATALNALANKPVGGFTCTGGPLPNTPIRVTATGRNLEAFTVLTKTKPYSIGGASPTQTISWVPPAATDYGFRPTQGNFTITVQQPNSTNTVVTNPLTPIPFNATPAQVKTALTSAPVSLPTADVTATGAALPTGTVTIQFLNASATASMVAINNVDLFGGQYLFDSFFRTFYVRFQQSTSDVLDPTTNEVAGAFGKNTDRDNELTGFAIRPVATPTGPVELNFAGTTTAAIDGITANIPSASRSGFIIHCDYTSGSALTINTSRSTYVGGSKDCFIRGLAVDLLGAVYLTGTVESTSNALTSIGAPEFSTTSGVFTNGNLLRKSDAFVRKYTVAGDIQFSALLGGSGDDEGLAIAVDPLNNIYVTGTARSFNYPRTVGAYGQTFSGSRQVYVTKISPSGNQILYSTGLQTIGTVYPNSIGVDSRGNAYVGGCIGPNPFIPEPINRVPQTPTAPFIPNQAAALDNRFTTRDVSAEGFISVVNSTGTGLLYSSYLGEDGSDDVKKVYVDANNSVHFAGTTWFNFYPYLEDNFLWPGAGHLTEPRPDIATGPLAGIPGINSNYVSGLAWKALTDAFDGFLVKMRIALPILKSIVVTPDQIAGGHGSTSSGVITLQEPAPIGGTQVTVRVLHPNIARLTLGGATSQRITIPQGATTANFTLFSKLVLIPSFCDVKAELDGDFLITRLNVRPWLDSFTLSTDTIAGGNTLQGTITLFQPAPAGGIDVTFATDSASLVKFPAGGVVNIPAGQQTAVFDIATEGVLTPTDTTVTASIDGVGQTQALKLLPPSVVNLSFIPSIINGGEETQGTITIDGKAAAGFVVDVTKVSGPAITFPAQVAFVAGANTASFQVQTPANSAVATSATLRADVNGSTTSGTFTIEANQIATLSLSTNSVLGGGVVNGVVTLTAPASASGFNIPLANSNPAAGAITPTTVFIPPGATSGSFTIQTFGVSSNQVMTVSTNKPGYAVLTQNLTVRALDFTFTINPNTLTGGQSSTATVSLLNGEVAPAGGFVFNMTSSVPSAAQVPSTVTIPAGASSTNFTITTSTVPNDVAVTLTASSNTGLQRTQVLNVKAPTLLSVSVSPSNPLGGSLATGTVSIGSPAPAGGLQISVSSNNTNAATVPATVTIPSGQTTASFVVTTLPVTVDTPVIISVTKGAQQKSTTITVRVSTISSFTFNPSTVLGGNSTIGTITLSQNAPAGGYVVTLTADKPQFVSFPATVTVPAGQKTVSFTVQCAQVTRLVGVVFTAQLGSPTNTLQSTLFIDRNTGG